MTSKLRMTVNALSVTTLIAMPLPSLAGGYGDTAIDDANVGRTASAGRTVFCPAIGEDVPERLAAEMDCDTVTATPRVLDDRIEQPTNIVSFLERFRHQPKAKPRVFDDNDDKDARPQTPPDAPGDQIVSGDTPSDSDRTPTGKWERLNELGVTNENFDSQSDGFREQFYDFLDNPPASGDWSEFDPT